jgi:hypothetical protein
MTSDVTEDTSKSHWIRSDITEFSLTPVTHSPQEKGITMIYSLKIF